MARLESVAVGGYYPTPRHLIPRIAPLVQPFMGQDSQVSFLDPCAGDGEAVLALMKQLSKGMQSRLYACEMEHTRYQALSMAAGAVKYALHTDAFRVSFERNAGVSLLFLNPPYDLDRVHGRLEHKFLVRFTDALADQGVLLFIVPFYALQASAIHLATHYQNVHCFKFPDQDFAAFKQVVLFAQRTEARLQPDPQIQRQVERYATGQGFLELPYLGATPLAALPEVERYTDPLTEWVARETDVASLLKKVRPWVNSGRNGSQTRVPGILPDLRIDELLLRTYPVATPPRPAHIASGIASGIFNGSRVTSDDAALPPLLVKGVFNQEYRTVEEKLDKHGNVRAWVQVQQPRLIVTVLDLSTYRYHTLNSEGEFSGSIDTLSVAGLLKYYGTSLMRVMKRQCPILYNPRRDRNSFELAPTARNLFSAQSDAAKALVMLLGGPGIPLKKRHGKGAILLGEIGSGKTTVSLAVAKTVGSRRPLVICPPHLLKSWADEIAKVLPEADVRILTEVSELEAVACDQSEGVIVSILSRETAKLGHGWCSVGEFCPKCGAPTPNEDHAKKRSRCEARILLGDGLVSRTVLQLAHHLKRFAPTDDTIQSLLKTRWGLRSIEWYKERVQVFPGLPAGYLDAVIERLRDDAQSEGYADEALRRALAWCLIASNDQARIATIADQLLGRETYSDQEFGRQLLYLLKPGGELQSELVARHRKSSSSYYNPWGGFEKSVEDLQKGSSYIRVTDLPVSWERGKLTVGGVSAASLEAACRAMRALTGRSNLRWGQECGEFLFEGVPEPRRIALAKHIQDRYPTTFDFLVLDECHEYGTEGSAQEKSAHRLTGLGLPTIQMSGSIMNGYAEHLFATVWSISAAFRAEFARADKQRFIDRYGYRKRLVTAREDDDQVIEYGAVSDRVATTERVIGNAPGVLPLFLLRHLLPLSVTLHKSDLALDLPRCIQERHMIDPGPVLKPRYDALKKALVDRIKRDQFKPELSGKLFGQLAELPSYLDRATVDLGNSDSGAYDIKYPESVGGDTVASQQGLPASNRLPKEQWMLEQIQRELEQGRNVLVFSWHVSLLPRIAGLISEAIDQKVPILYANKVGTAKRQEWITKNVVAKRARVMVTNPVAIQTGLNNLVHFATEIWLENPMCNPVVYRQAAGRVDRIGQTQETRILFPVYKDTLQVQLHELLLNKVAISTATDGLDPESALLASGVVPDDYLTGLSIGKQLWAMLSSDRPARASAHPRPAMINRVEV